MMYDDWNFILQWYGLSFLLSQGGLVKNLMHPSILFLKNLYYNTYLIGAPLCDDTYTFHFRINEKYA